MKIINNLIVGAGVSGLSYAAQLTDNDNIVIEKENEPGGYCRTVYQDGFTWDYAGHFFHFSTEEIKKFFDDRIPKSEMVQCEKKTGICYDENTVIDYPFQTNIHQLPKEEFIDCLYDLFHRKLHDKYNSFEEMLYGKFGKSITDKFLKPYNEKLYACDLNALDTEAMGRFFPYAEPMSIINNMREKNNQSYNSNFEYPIRGAIKFVDVLVKEIKKKNNARIELNSTLERIDIDRQIAIVNGESYHYERLVNTIPLNMFVKMLPENISAGIDKYFNCNKVLVFNLGFDKPSSVNGMHWLYFPKKKCNFYRVGFYDNIVGSDRMSLYVEIGFARDEVIDFDEQLKLTIDNLRAYHIIDKHELIAKNIVVMNPAYVHITDKSRQLVNNMRTMLADYNIYTIGRYGAWTYCSIEDCMIEARSLVKKLNKICW